MWGVHMGQPGHGVGQHEEGMIRGGRVGPTGPRCLNLVCSALGLLFAVGLALVCVFASVLGFVILLMYLVDREFWLCVWVFWLFVSVVWLFVCGFSCLFACGFGYVFAYVFGCVVWLCVWLCGWLAVCVVGLFC